MKLICPARSHETHCKPEHFQLGVEGVDRARRLESFFRLLPFPVSYEHDGFSVKWEPPKPLDPAGGKEP